MRQSKLNFEFNKLRAGNGIRVGLQNLLNDNSEEAKLLTFQLELLKNHLGGSFKTFEEWL